MAENSNQLKNSDALLGDTNSAAINAAILGTIEAIKKRLASPAIEVRIAALSDALIYEETGLDLILQALQDECIQVKLAAYSLLQDRQESKVKQQLDNFLPSLKFEVWAIDGCGKIKSRFRHKGQYFTDDLPKKVKLEMLLIPGGAFLMGSPETEQRRDDRESPQHPVTVQPFLMSKYPVTQAQWNAIATLPQINISLNPELSDFKGANRPVENVSWYEAQEFCARLSKQTGKTYRLPSEAEWEYAARAGTTTPFHFGETITTKLANYNGEYPYASEPKGSFREQTTKVGSFPPNAFGLYDMHGNVLEWCADPWHNNYNDAPQNGNVWESSEHNPYRVLRGGSWMNYPELCRSAYRTYMDAEIRYSMVGFRVVCSIA